MHDFTNHNYGTKNLIRMRKNSVIIQSIGIMVVKGKETKVVT